MTRSLRWAIVALTVTCAHAREVAAQDDAERLRKKAEELQREAQRMAERAEKARLKAEEEARKKAERKAKRDAEKAEEAEKKRQKEEAKKAKREEEAKSEPPPPPPPEPVAPPPAASAPAPVAAPPPPAGPPPRVESVAGARWSSSLGFLHTGLTAVSVLGPDGTSHVATTSAAPPIPKDSVTGEPIVERNGIEGGGFGFFALGVGFVSFNPTVDGVESQQKLEGNDFQLGVKLVFGNSGVGGWIAPGMRIVTAKDEFDNSLFVFSPMGFDGGLDFYLVEDHLSLGPRLGAFVAPLFIYSPADTGSTSASSDPGVWFGVEYGGTLRSRVSSLYAEASFYFRKGIDTTGQYLALEAGYVIRPAVIFVGYETRMEAEGTPDFSDSVSQGLANSMPEQSRLSVGLGIAFN